VGGGAPPPPQVGAILTAGAAGLVGGALSMAVGEYISVSSQSDSQRALIAKERAELLSSPDEELAELAGIYESRGLTADTARQVAIELTAHDALAAHLSAELNIDETEVASPWAAAVASAIAFVSGAILPLAAILLLPQPVRIPLTFAIVVLALAGTGALGARVGGSPLLRATIRVTVGGALALAATFLIGSLLGTTGVA
jgi:VIT1/CCC1 family predicted Fe2+/Mn2+ transporter